MLVKNPNCCGLDVHQKVVVGCLRIMGDDGHATTEMQEFSTTVSGLTKLVEWLGTSNCPIVGMESTGVYWKPIYHILSRHVDVIVGNARDISRFPGQKTDKKDAAWIAELLAHDLIKPSFIPSPEIQALRDMTRTRASLVQTRSQIKNRVLKYLEDTNIKISSVISDVFGKSGREMLENLIAGTTEAKFLAGKARGRLRRKLPALELALEGSFTTHHGALIKMGLEEIDLMSKHIGELEEKIDEALKPHHRELELLESIPGISRHSAGTIIAEIGPDMQRFGSAERLASWAGVCPGNNESAGKRKSGKIRKGNKWLKRVLVQCAWAVKKSESFLGRTLRRLQPRIGGKKAAVAIAHKMTVFIFSMLINGEYYDESRYEHLQPKQEERYKKKVIKQLERMGYTVILEKAEAIA